jgi:hypothetical protein
MYTVITSLAHLYICNSFTFLANTESEIYVERSALFVWTESQVCTGVLRSLSPIYFPFNGFFFQSREQVVVRRGQIRRIGSVIKILEAQVDQFLLGCKCLVNRFLPGRVKDLSAPLYVECAVRYWFGLNGKCVYNRRTRILKRDDPAVILTLLSYPG